MNNKHRSKLRFNNRNLSFSDSSKTIKIYIIFSTPVIYQYTYLEIKFVHNTKSWFDKIYTIIMVCHHLAFHTQGFNESIPLNFLNETISLSYFSQGLQSPVNMPIGASTGPVLVRRWQHRPSTGPVLARNGIFTGEENSTAGKDGLILFKTDVYDNKEST